MMLIASTSGSLARSSMQEANRQAASKKSMRLTWVGIQHAGSKMVACCSIPNLDGPRH